MHRELPVRHIYALVSLAAVLATALPLAAERPEPEPPADFASRFAAWERHQELDQGSLFRGLEWRTVGPVIQGGRVVDVESVPGEP